jgi:iron(III) transport system permease protein
MAVAVLMGAVLVPPLAAPVLLLLREPGWWEAWSDPGRSAALAGNTLALISGTLALAMPAGIVLAVLLRRTDLPFRNALHFLVLLLLFVPLPLAAVGWQALLDAFPSAVWVPWAQGLGPAVLIQAAAALPWVVLLVGLGLSWGGRELEEDALTAAGPWRVLWRVTLPRCAASVGTAALWIALQAAGEIAVTDVYQVRTFGEEVYTQFVAPDPAGSLAPDSALARAVAIVLPATAFASLLLAVLAGRWERGLPPGESTATPPVLAMGRMRWPLTVLTGLFLTLLVGLPMGGLVRRAGLTGTPAAWSPEAFVGQLGRAFASDGSLIAGSLVLAAASGMLAATLGLAVCWAVRGAPMLRTVALVVLAFAWALPGPVLGLGLKEVINGLLDGSGSRWLETVLYQGPSPAPLVWIDVVRFLPCAVALLWPVVRRIPPELSDAARVDGAGPLLEFRHVVWPAAHGAWGRAALAVAILSLGELSAGKLVSTPGWPSYAEVLFQRMHYGVTADLAAGSLWLLIIVVGAGLVGWGARATDKGS